METLRSSISTLLQRSVRRGKKSQNSDTRITTLRNNRLSTYNNQSSRRKELYILPSSPHFIRDVADFPRKLRRL